MLLGPYKGTSVQGNLWSGTTLKNLSLYHIYIYCNCRNMWNVLITSVCIYWNLQISEYQTTQHKFAVLYLTSLFLMGAQIWWMDFIHLFNGYCTWDFSPPPDSFTRVFTMVNPPPSWKWMESALSSAYNIPKSYSMRSNPVVSQTPRICLRCLESI